MIVVAKRRGKLLTIRRIKQQWLDMFSCRSQTNKMKSKHKIFHEMNVWMDRGGKKEEIHF